MVDIYMIFVNSLIWMFKSFTLLSRGIPGLVTHVLSNLRSVYKGGSLNFRIYEPIMRAAIVSQVKLDFPLNLNDEEERKVFQSIACGKQLSLHS